MNMDSTVFQFTFQIELVLSDPDLEHLTYHLIMYMKKKINLRHWKAFNVFNIATVIFWQQNVDPITGIPL